MANNKFIAAALSAIGLSTALNRHFIAPATGDGERPARLRNKSKSGKLRKVKNAVARASRKRNRQ